MKTDAIDRATLSRLLRKELRPHRKMAFVAFAFMVVAALATTASTYIIKLIVDDIFVAQNAALVLPIALAIVVIYVIKGIATYFSTSILEKLSASIAADLRHRAVDRLLSQSVDFFDHVETSTIINRVVQVTKSAGELVRTLLTAGIKDTLTVIFLVALMLSQDWILTLAVMTIAPLAIYGVSQISRRLRGSVQGEFDGNGQFIQLMFERFQNIRLIKSYHVENETKGKFNGTINAIRKHTSRLGRVAALRSPLMETLGGIAVALMIIYAGYAISSGRATAGEIFLIITAFLTAYEPMKNLAKLRIELIKNMLPLSEYYEMIDLPFPDETIGEPLRVDAGKIEFRDVAFGYGDENVAVLNSVNFTVNAGTTTAIVGPSGAGKSTVYALLQGHYQPQSGAILIDGQDMANGRTADIRRAIAPIPQDIAVFTGSIYDNIAIGNLDAPRDAVLAAARAAQMEEFLARLPNGIDTLIGDGEASLSGGQRQRLGIARAILKDAPILLLDEATSALDSASEEKVQAAIKAAATGKTVLVIAHRLSTIRDADSIIVMDGGHVVEQGTHAQLVAHNGIYAHLDALQSQSK